jgi:hypothetical protein
MRGRKEAKRAPQHLLARFSYKGETAKTACDRSRSCEIDTHVCMHTYEFTRLDVTHSTAYTRVYALVCIGL